MIATGLNYHDLLQAAGVNQGNFQAFIDGYFATKYNTAMWDGFEFDAAPMLDYTYTQFQAELKLNVMATYVNPDSPAKMKSTEGFSELSGTIPTMKSALVRDSKEQRELMKMQMASGDSTVNLAINQLYRTLDQLLGEHVNSISYQRNQMVSKGKLELLDANNPGGIKNITFSAQIPAANIVTKTNNAKWWTDATRGTEGSSADPIADIEAEIQKMQDAGVSAITIEMDKLTLKATLGHTKVLAAIGYNLNPLVADATVAKAIASNLSYNQKVAAFQGLFEATLKVTDQIAAVETFDKATMKPKSTQMRSFAANVVSLYPTGNIGKIKHVLPILPAQGFQGATARYFNGSLLMRTYSDINTNVQYFNTEQALLAVIDKPKYFHILNVL
jgi:hypothetical protein